MEKTGWSRGKAVNEMGNAKIKVGISYRDYSKYNFYEIAESEQEEGYRKVLEKKERRRQQKEHWTEQWKKREQMDYRFHLYRREKA